MNYIDQIQVGTTTYDIIDTNGRLLTENKLDKITSYSSGNIITINNAAETLLKNLKIYFSPIQDLHGYDAPWPAGGGKNLLDVSNGTGAEMRGVTPSYDGAGGLTFSGIANDSGFGGNWTLTGGLTLPAGTYTISIGQSIGYRLDLLSGWSSKAYINASNTSNTFTLSEETTIDKITLTVTSGETVSVNVKKIQIESGSTATSYAPYSNICPISGHSNAVVTRAGKNLLPYAPTTQTINHVTFTANADGSITVSGTASADTTYELVGMYNKDKLFHLVNQSLKGSGCPSGGSNSTYFLNFQGFATDGIGIQDYGNGCTINATDFRYFRTVQVYIRIKSGYTANNLVFKPMLRLSSDTDATFEPYQGTSVTIALGSTVYGGTLDVVAGTLTVDRAMIALDNRGTWQKSISYPGGFYMDIGNGIKYHYGALFKVQTPFICSHAKTAYSLAEYLEGTCYCDNSMNIRIMDADTTAQQWQQYLQDQYDAGTPVEVCAYLATPVTVTLTPAQMSLLLGENNIWSDTGNIEVTYYTNSIQDFDDRYYTENEINTLLNDKVSTSTLGSLATKNTVSWSTDITDIPLLGHWAFMNSNNGLNVYMITTES